MKNALFFILLLTSSLLPGQNPGTYSLDLGPEGSPMTWQVTTLWGPMLGDPNFALLGETGLYVNSTQSPFGSGGFGFSPFNNDLVTNPTELYGYVRNPIPGSPPLIELWVRDSEFWISSPIFPIDAVTGAFSTTSTMYYSGGEIEVLAFGSSYKMPLANQISDPFVMAGTVIQYGGKIELESSVQYTVQATVGALSAIFSCGGPLYAEAPVYGISPNLTVPVLQSGQPVSFTLDTGVPSSPAWLVASIAGPGSVVVKPLRINLGIASPVLLGRARADVAGACAWNLTVPNVSGLAVWFQVCQLGAISNVVAASVQ